MRAYAERDTVADILELDCNSYIAKQRCGNSCETITVSGAQKRGAPTPIESEGGPIA